MTNQSPQMQAYAESQSRSNHWGIQCASCGHVADYDDWMETPINGALPKDQYQCPHCRCAFERTKQGIQPIPEPL